MIFLDTSAIYALADEADPNHERAKMPFQQALEAEEDLLVHNYILAGVSGSFAEPTWVRFSCPISARE